LNFIESMSVL